MLRGWLHHSSPSARSVYLLSPQQLRPRSMPPAHRPGSVFLLSWKRGVPLAPQAGRLHPVATNMPPTSWAQSLPRRRSCEGLGNGASHGNGGLSPSGTDASRREQFAALRAANGKARRTFVLRALLTPCLGVAAQPRRRMAAITPCLGVAPARGEDGSRGTCRPTRRPTAVRAASQTAPAVCPRSAGVRVRAAKPRALFPNS